MTQTNKNIQDLFKTYVAKSEGEEKFRKAHVVSTVDNNDEKLGPKDDQFVATTKTYARDTTHHGYDAGGDEKVYSEEALDEMSSKMKMKLGLYGKKKKMEEEVEELDEAALKQAENRHFEKQLPKMQAAINLELRKGKDYQDAVAAARRHFKEEVEELDEISKATMGRYINKAAASIDLTAWRQGYKEAGAGNPSKQLEKKLSKRHKGIETAVKKLTREEVEQIDELSKKTLGSYVKKASGAERPKNPMNPKSVPITTIAAYQGDSETGHFGKRFNQRTYDKAERLRKNRETGIKRAVDKMTNEDAKSDYSEAGDAERIRKRQEGWQKTHDAEKAFEKRAKSIKHADEFLQRYKGVKEEVELDEKKLTKAELEKREEVAAAMERENPGMDMSKKMAIATAQAKKVAEEVDLDEGRIQRIVQGAIAAAKGAKGYAQQAMARMRTVPPAPAGTPRLPAPGTTGAPRVGILPKNRSVVTTTPAAPRTPLAINAKTATAAAVGTALAGGAGTYLATRDSSASAAPAAAKPAKANTAAAAPAANAAPAAAKPAKANTAAGNSSGTYKVKGVDVTQDVKDITKANPSITNPNMIRTGQKIKVGGSDYTVQKGDTLSGIAARRRSSAAAAPKAATATATPEAPKAAPAATASATPEAPKANDFSDVKADSGPIAPKHDDHAQGYDNKSPKQIKADARAAIRTQRVLAKASKLQATRGDDYSAAYANRKMADIAGDTEKAYGHEDQASAYYGKRAEYGRNMNIIRRNNSVAAAQANKVQEEIELGEAVNSDDAFDRLEKAGAKDVKTTSGGIRYTHGGKEYNLRHNMKRTGHRTVRSAELAQHLDRLQEEVEVVEEQFAPGRFKQAMIERALNTLNSYVYGENNLDD